MFRKFFLLLERMVRALEAIANRPRPEPDLSPVFAAVEQLEGRVAQALGQLRAEAVDRDAVVQRALVELRERDPPAAKLVERVGVLEVDHEKTKSLVNSVKSAFYRSQEGKRRDRADDAAPFVLPGGLVPIGGGSPRPVGTATMSVSPQEPED